MLKRTLSVRKKFVPLFLLILATSFSSFTGFKSNFLFASTAVMDEVLLEVNPFSYDPEIVIVESENSFYNAKISLFDSLDLDSRGLGYEAFDLAIRGMDKLVADGAIERPEILTIVDFSKPSTEKRLFIIDLEEKEILFNTYVSHGRNSGKLNAEKFSNRMSSNQSSLGFFKTAETYRGGHGYSLKLDGLERGINDRARDRAIVVHGADYVNPNLIHTQGYIGRSLGCPAVSLRESKKIIDNIKDGSVFFIYHPSQDYLRKSTVLN